MKEHPETRSVPALLTSLRNFVYADGHCDITEAKALIGLLKPFLSRDPDVRGLHDLLVDIAADGIVTQEESERLEKAIAEVCLKYSTFDGIYDARTLGLPKMGLLGVQHLFAMFGATVLVPILTGLSISATLLFAGLGTLLFHFLTKRKVPAFLGSSFAFLPGYFALAAMKDGIWEGLTKNQLLVFASVGVAVSALAYVVVSGIVKSVGVKRVMQFFPPVVTGPIIIGIGLCLAPVAVNSSSTCWPVALAGILAVLIASCFGKGMIRIIPILIGVIVSYLAAIVFGNCCGVPGAAVDFSKIATAPWIGLPFQFGDTVFALGSIPGDNVGRVLSAIAIVVPLCAATMMEHVGDISAISSTVKRNFFADPGLHRTLLGDGLATLLASLFGAPANTTYGENTGVLSLSKVYDPRVIRIAAVLAALLAFCPKFAALIATLPAATVGGVSFVLYGMISAVGVRNLIENQVDFSKPRNMLICALIIVCALGIGFSDAHGISFAICNVQITLSGLAVGALMGIILNALLPGKDYQFNEEDPNLKDPERWGGVKSEK